MKITMKKIGLIFYLNTRLHYFFDLANKNNLLDQSFEEKDL